MLKSFLENPVDNAFDFDFDFILGVDQTGAKGVSGKAKKLPTSLLYRVNNKWSLLSPLYLESFDWKSIKELLLSKNLNPQQSKTLVVADCVLGLPERIVKNQDPLTLILKSMRSASSHEGVGLKAGEFFFKKNFPEAQAMTGLELTRTLEKKLGCLSVFKNKPFQKNVQTGTYRIWSDLGENESYNDFNIWPYQNAPGRAYLCEGYPAYAKKSMKDKNKKFLDGLSSDHQDASALCFLGLNCFGKVKNKKSLKEGCVLVLEEDL